MGVVGWHGITSERNDNREKLASFCDLNDFIKTTTMFPYKTSTYTHVNRVDNAAIN